MANILSINIHPAQASMLGYRFQPLYALLVLWKESEDDFDEIAVESDDDVVLKSKHTKLYQLKHSAGKSGSLTFKNDGFWRTNRIGHLMRTPLNIKCISSLETQ